MVSDQTILVYFKEKLMRDFACLLYLRCDLYCIGIRLHGWMTEMIYLICVSAEGNNNAEAFAAPPTQNDNYRESAKKKICHLKLGK